MYLEDAFKAWIRDQKVSPPRKADFVMTLIGSGELFSMGILMKLEIRSYQNFGDEWQREPYLLDPIGIAERNDMNSSNRPVVKISWWSAAEYLNRKSRLEGLEPVFDFSRVRWINGSAEEGTLEGEGEVIININANGYRFPTEAEHEYFIRAGTKTTYPTGEWEARLPLVAWFEQSFARGIQPIGQLRPNPFGLVDTLGNGWEWGLDWYDDLSKEAAEDPMGPPSGSYHVARGGYWYSLPFYLRSTRRDQRSPRPWKSVGFRALRTAK